MSNVLKVTTQATIRDLHKRGWSGRRIARELGLNRRTVCRYLGSDSKCTSNSTPGSAGEAYAKCTTISTPGSEEDLDSKCTTNSIAGSERELPSQRTTLPATKQPGRKSHCEPFGQQITTKAAQGLSAQRIYQDLVGENAFRGSYQSVKRFVGKIQLTQPVPVARMECQPGEEMQVDFGLGAPILEGDKSRRSWVFRAVLSYSRKGYSEAVLRQDTETFLRCLENALRSWGGCPLLLNLDNLKAAVLKADWFDPEINPKLADFCRHYGMHVMPCRPWTPQHKGKVERGIGYVRNNALKGRSFPSVAKENIHLQWWETHVADQRIHGTTCKQVRACFELERPSLQPLPSALFPCYQEARRSVQRDGYVEVQKAFYHAPPELIGHQVWVRWDSRCLRIFNARMEQVAMHTRIEAGKFSRPLGAGGFRAPTLASCRYWVNRAAVLGEHCGQWAQAAFEARGPEALRSIMALCGLIRKHSGTVLNLACAKAQQNGLRRFKDIRRLIGEQDQQSTFEFEQSHPLIRDLSAYSEFIIKHTQHTNQHDQHPQTTCP